MKSSLAIGLALLASNSNAYAWPSPYDQIDDLLYLQSGLIKNGALSDRACLLSYLHGLAKKLTQRQKLHRATLAATNLVYKKQRNGYEPPSTTL